MSRRIFSHVSYKILMGWIMFALAHIYAGTSVASPTPTPVAPVAPVPNPCPRFTAGSVVQTPLALYSSAGLLNVSFSYQTTVDSQNRQLFCFTTPSWP
jgi:hypothetical protein